MAQELKFKWTLWLIMFTPLIMLISILSAGGGHGTQLPTLLLYPIMFLFRVFESGGGPFVWGMLLGQFPFYGLLIDLGRRTTRPFLVTGFVVLFHSTLVLLAMRGVGY